MNRSFFNVILGGFGATEQLSTSGSKEQKPVKSGNAEDAACSVAPNPPKITLKKERFIPLHIMYDKIAPEEPTSAPVIISALFSKVNPIPAAAQPEYEFNIEITTGISAPPIGIINKNPIKNETINSIQKKLEDCVEHNK